jgi:hypothetical protein
MTSVVELFTSQLARGGGRQATRFLRARGVPEADRDDVIAAAMLWCWENRHNYSLTTTLETWFMNAVRDAYRGLRRRELPTSSESIENMSGGADETYNQAAAASAARALFDAMPAEGRRVARGLMRGHTRQELERMGFSKRAIDDTRHRIRRLRRLLPGHVGMDQWLTAAAPDPDEVDDQLSDIDREIEQLEFSPPTGKDCPPCWRCKWFEGMLPADKRSTRMEIEDAEVRAAVRDTEARKIEIANQVRRDA